MDDFDRKSNAELAALARGNAAMYHAEGPNAVLRAFLLVVAKRLEAAHLAEDAEA